MALSILRLARRPAVALAARGVQGPAMPPPPPTEGRGGRGGDGGADGSCTSVNGSGAEALAPRFEPRYTDAEPATELDPVLKMVRPLRGG